MDATRQYEMLAQKVALFHGLKSSDIAAIFSRGMTVRVLKGETVFYKDTVGSQMFVVLGGQVTVNDGKKRIATLSPGAMFGEMALLNEEPRSATVTASEDSLLFVLSETTFQRLLTKRVAVRILLNIIRTLSNRLRESNAKISRMQTGE